MKYLIQLRQANPKGNVCYLPDDSKSAGLAVHWTAHCLLGTIRRKLVAIQVGNFNPIYCRYAGKVYLVHSDEGDMSDPFRREQSYAKSLFIDVNSPCKFNRL